MAKRFFYRFARRFTALCSAISMFVSRLLLAIHCELGENVFSDLRSENAPGSNSFPKKPEVSNIMEYTALNLPVVMDFTWILTTNVQVRA